MAVECVLPGLERTEPGEHLCGLYQGEHQRKEMLVPFLHQGLTGGQRALCIVNTRDAEVVLGDLRDARTDPQEDLAAGRLCMLTPEQIYVSDGIFDPDRMIDLLRAQADRAAAEGYAALRLVCDMSWAMELPSPCERLIEYESKLNEFLRTSKCLALCLYDRRCFDPALLLDVLGHHPTVVVDSRVRKNVAHAPPSTPVRQLGSAAHEKPQDELQHRDELFRQILECTSDGINVCEVDLKTGKKRLILCNDKYVEMSGRTREELMNADNLSEFRKDLHPSRMQFVNELLRQGETCAGVSSCIRPDGKENWYEYVASPMEIGQDKLVVVGIDRDITKRRKAEEAIRLHSQIVRNIAEGIHLVRASDGVIVYTNPRMEEMFGYDSGQLTGKHVSILNAPSERNPQEVADQIIRALEQNGTWSGEIHNIRKDGTTLWCRANFSTFDHPEHGEVWVAVMQDITDRKRAGEALRQSEENLRRILASSPDAIMVSDLRGNIIQCNEAALHTHGFSGSQELIGTRMLDLIAPKDRHRAAANLQKTLERGYVRDSQYICLKKDGRKFPAELSTSVIRGTSGKTASFIAITRDITARTRAEERLRKSRQQLRALAAHLQSVREEERSHVARGIHDDLGHALASLKMDLSWLDKNLAQSPQAPAPPDVRERMKTMLDLVDETIRNVRQVAADLRPGVLDDLGLSAALEWEVKRFEARTGIQCTFTSSAEQVQLDREQSTALYRICQELLTNVASHSGASAASVSLELKGRHLLLKVYDNGSGITNEEISSSTSLGILGMRERALLLAGTFNISGARGKGTTARVRILVSESKQAEGK